jgi:hypothetical protein
MRGSDEVRTVPRPTLARALVAAMAAVVLAAAGPLHGQAHPGTPAPAEALASLRRAFEAPPDDARIMMRWWWFGPAVTRAGLERELRQMKAGGIGGVEIQPVYPLALDDAASGVTTHPFLSDAFLDDIRHAADTARGLGLRVDVTVGSGWPFGGPQVPIADAAGKLRVERSVVEPGSTLVPVPDIRAGERLLAAFLAPRVPIEAASDLREVSDIADGRLRLPGPAPVQREVVFFVSSRTGMMVKRPAVGAEGFVLDHYDRAAVERYLGAVGDRLRSAFGATPPHAVFCDSLEVYDSDWTDDFLETFRRRRGYDLRPLLPALVVDGADTPDLRHDWGRTLTELVRERFLDTVQAWARQRGTRFRVQGYGVPPAILSSNAEVDLPEGEGAQWKTVRASRWAASIGHLYDRPVISSETWTWLHSPSFRATPLDVKAEADLHFLQGINQLIGHGWPYTPEGVAYPGGRFYAAGVFNDSNPWWIVMPDLARYLQRVSFLLRQGRPVVDVALYLPAADTWSHFEPGKVGSMIETMNRRVDPGLLPALLAAGFNVDFVDDEVLAERARLEAGTLAIGQGRYRAIVLPGIERIPAATMRAIEAFAAGGVRVVATGRRPALAPGHLASAADRALVVAASARLFTGVSPTGTFVERASDVGAALASAVPADMTVSDGAADLGAVHRRTPEADIYFVANTSNVPIEAQATFRVEASRAERWDPLTGTAFAVPTRQAASGAGTTVTLDLAPYGSTVFVFPVAGPTAAAPRAPRERAGTAPAAQSLDLGTGWRVRFGPEGTAADWDTLRSWTSEEATRYFSGVAVYEKSIDLPASMLSEGQAVVLDFGAARPVPAGSPTARVQAFLDAPVREAAVVTVNGVRAGSLWCPPYVLDVTAHLRRGVNTLRVEVANLAVNHMAGRALPDYTLLNLRYGKRFDPQDMDQVQPVPAGLLGPIRLRTAPVGRATFPSR